MKDLGSVFGNSGTLSEGELVEILASSRDVTVQKIRSPRSNIPSKLYDQEENEFVIIVRGCAELEVWSSDYGNKRVVMRKGDYFNIPAHLKHRVAKTRRDTTWLAVFYKK